MPDGTADAHRQSVIARNEREVSTNLLPTCVSVSDQWRLGLKSLQYRLHIEFITTLVQCSARTKRRLQRKYPSLTNNKTTTTTTTTTRKNASTFSAADCGTFHLLLFTLVPFIRLSPTRPVSTRPESVWFKWLWLYRPREERASENNSDGNKKCHP